MSRLNASTNLTKRLGISRDDIAVLSPAHLDNSGNDFGSTCDGTITAKYALRIEFQN